MRSADASELAEVRAMRAGNSLGFLRSAEALE